MINENLLTKMCFAIQAREGWAPGTTSYRNCNPFNLKYAGQLGSTGKDARGFAVFPTYESGLNAGRRQILLVASGKSKVYPNPCTLTKFFAIYAPASDNNAPVEYVKFVAGKMGVDTTFILSELLE